MTGMIKKIGGIGVLLNRIFLGLLTLWAFASFLLVVLHILLTFGKTPWPIIEWLPDLILGWFGTNSENLIENNIYEVIVADMIAICAFVFAVVPSIQAGIYKIDLKYKLRKAHGLEVFEVKTEGIDDLEKMLECYDRAEHITVFCGDFDWLQPNNIMNTDKYRNSSEKQKKKYEQKAQEMKDFVVGYAAQRKITLISSKSIDLVKDALKDADGNFSLFESLENRFVFNNNIGIKCSLIEHLHDTYAFLYRSHSDDEDHSFNAHIFTGATEGDELINILRKLIESGGWEDKTGQHMN